MSVNLPVVIEAISNETAPVIYKTDGLKPYLQHIKEQVSGEVPDLTTKKGRDRIASLSAMVSKSKTAVEKPGRDYLKRLKELPKEIEKELKTFVDECDFLRDEIRKPLTDWENANKAREAAHVSNIQSFGEWAQSGSISAEIAGALAEIESRTLGDHCEEYLSQYVAAKDSAIAQLKQRYQAAVEFEAQQAELERLRKEAAEREQKEREERLMREAADNARREAEQKAQRERDEVARIEREKQLESERREMQLKLQVEAAERQRLEAEQRAEQRADYERQQSEIRAKQAAEAERLRIEQQQAAERAEAEKQAANKAHSASVNREILSALVGAGFSEEQGKLVVRLAASKLCGQLVINY
jgi:hypothetical protein